MARKPTKKAITAAKGSDKKPSSITSHRKNDRKPQSPQSKNQKTQAAKFGNRKGSKGKKQQQQRQPSQPKSEDEDSVIRSDEEDEEDNKLSVPEEDDNVDEENGMDDIVDDDEEDKEVEKTGFTDENAKWLKPKRKEQSKQKSQLLSSDEDDDDDAIGGDEFDIDKDMDDDREDEDDVDDDDEDELEVERQSRRLDEEMLEQQAEADQELRRTIAENTEIFHLPTKEELDKDGADRVVPPSEIKARVESIMEVLADFKNRREEGRSRSEYVEQLISDIAELHGYLPELVDYFHSMFGPTETLEFVDSSDKPRPLVIRTNTLKARRKDLAAALMKRGVTLDPLAWSKVGLKIIESPVPIGATPEYLSGMYMLQSAASMCPVMALSPQLKEKVLDMSAAPGGKTSYIAQLMRNTGVIYANDLKAERQKATVANLHRLGVKNVVACALDGRKLGKMFRNRFDRILLDAPCSGLGVISRDPSVKIQRTIADVQRCAHLQKELLLAAIDALNHKSKTGGVMVYSTCSVSVAENEEVVHYALSKRDIKIVDTGIDFGKQGFTRYQQKRFHPSVALTRRFYPHVHNMDGFYVAKIQKLSDKRPDEVVEEQKQEPAKIEEEVEEAEEEQADGAEADKNSESSEDSDKFIIRSKGKGKRKIVPVAKKNAVDGPASKKPRREGKSERKLQKAQLESAANKRGGLTKKDTSKTPAAGKPTTPNKDAQNKKKLNAKMTKPRRPKASSMV